MKSKFGRLAAFGPLVLGGFLAGCGDDVPGLDALGDIAEQCGLKCEGGATGIVAGNASISGVASVDAFFGAVVNFDTRANAVAEGIATALGKIGASVGVEAGGDVAAGLDTFLAGKVQGGLTVNYQEPKCQVSASASIEATAKCDASVEPGSVKAECSGSCEADVSAMAECSGEATLKCTGTAPNLECSGECSGTCELDASGGITCDGTCNGECQGTCSVQNTDGSCKGNCDGTCTGSCEVKGEAAVNCSGSCKGDCTYEAPSGGCEASASAKCEASASGSVECSGKCEGEVTPPSASAECEASASANAEMNAECTPPSIDISYQLSGSLQGDAAATAEFEAWVEGFKGNMQALVTALAEAEVVVNAGAGLTTAASGAVKGAIEAQASGDVSLKASVGLACAVTELGAVAGVISGATSKLTGQVEAAGKVTAVLGG